jgi:sulfur transfer complex TusBCD TusB component (DsrH family)
MLNAYDDVLLLVNGVYKPMQIVPHHGLSFDLAVLAHEHGITAALPATYYHTLVAGNNNSLVSLSHIHFHSHLLHPGNILES